MKPKRSPAPDGFRTEIFAITPVLFAHVLMCLWRAFGQVGKLQSLFCSGLLCIVYKQKEYQTVPSNNRTIELFPSFRPVISTEITLEVRKQYFSEPNQLGFKIGMNTECETVFATNQLPQKLPYAALLDLKKAYDLAQRGILQILVDERLPLRLSVMIRAMIAPMRSRKQLQQSNNEVLTVAGVPQ